MIARLGVVAALLSTMLVAPRTTAGAAGPDDGISKAPTPQECARYGAEAFERGCPVEDFGPVMPLPPLADHDRGGNGQFEGCWGDEKFVEFRSCMFGPAGARSTVALVGNSHAAQYLAPLREWAERDNFRLVTFLIPKCFATTERIHFDGPGMTERCFAWGEWVQEQTEILNPDLIVTSERTYRRPAQKAPEGTAAAFERGYAEYLKVWTERGHRILVVRDNPVPREKVPDCLQRNPTRYSACAGERSRWLPPDPLVQAARSLESDRIRVADLSHYYCNDLQCPAVIGGMLVYRDGSHLSATWIRAFAPLLEPEFTSALTEAQMERSGSAIVEDAGIGDGEDP